MTFEEMVAMLANAKTGETELPANIFDDIRREYQTVIDGSAASIKERDEQLTAERAEVTRLKSMNFDLLMKSGVNTVDNDDDEGDDGSEDQNPPSGGIDSLFK